LSSSGPFPLKNSPSHTSSFLSIYVPFPCILRQAATLRHARGATQVQPRQLRTCCRPSRRCTTSCPARCTSPPPRTGCPPSAPCRPPRCRTRTCRPRASCPRATPPGGARPSRRAVAFAAASASAAHLVRVFSGDVFPGAVLFGDAVE
jgi:hypothetical protein